MSGKVVALKRKLPRWERVSSNLVLNVESGYYYVRKFNARKGHLFKTTGQRTKGKAQTVADAIMAEWLGGKHSGRRIRVGEIIDLLDTELESLALEKDDRGRPLRSRNTRINDKNVLKQIREYFGDSFVDEIDEQYWDRWVKATGRKLGKRLGEISKYLSKVLTYAYLNKHINRKPRIKNPDPVKQSVPTYERKQIEAMLKAANPTLQDLIVLGAECGLRPHENLGMRWEWVRFTKDGALLSIPDWFEKRARAREIHLSANATAVLKRRKRRAVGPYVFPSPSDPLKPMNRVRLSRYWQRMRRCAQITDRALFHWLRHSFFTHALLKSDQPLAKVAAYGGNSPKVLFDRYLAKDASKTRELTGVLNLNMGEEE